jgi:hypothetical protein
LLLVRLPVVCTVVSINGQEVAAATVIVARGLQRQSVTRR